jgi:hypothetical protein
MLIARRFVPRASRLRFDRRHEEISATEPEDVAVTVTPADHAWQNAYPGASPRRFKPCVQSESPSAEKCGDIAPNSRLSLALVTLKRLA